MSRQGSQGKGAQSMMIRKMTSSSKGDLSGLIDETGESDQISTESRLILVRDAFISVFEEMSLSRTLGVSTFYFLHIIGMLQLLLLPLSPAPSMPWRSDSIDQETRISGGVEIVTSFHAFLLNVVLFPFIDGFGRLSSIPSFTLWACTSFLSSAILALFLWGLVRSFKGLSPNRNSWRVATLRLFTSLATIALPIPIFVNLLGPIACLPNDNIKVIPHNSWAGFVCWQAPHLGIFSFSLITLALLTGYMVLATLLFQSRSPDAKAQPTAVMHGRIETTALCIKGILAAIYACGQSLSPWIHGSANLIGGVSLCVVYIRFLPFMSPKLNQFVVALNAAFLASSIACILAIAVSAGSGPAFASAAGGLLWAFILPLGVFFGWTLTDARWRTLGKSADLSDVFIIELRLRWLLAEGLRLQACALANGRSLSSGTSRSLPEEGHIAVPISSSASKSACPMRGVDGEISECDDAVLPEGHPPTAASSLHSASAKTTSSKRIPTSSKPPPYGLFGSGLLATNEATSSNLRSINRLLSDALSAFPANPLIHLFAAHVLRAASGNVYLEAVHLRQAGELADTGSIDVHFYTRLRQTQLGEENRRALTGKMTVETRIYFESQMTIASSKVATCRTAILSFWTSLCDPTPDLVALQAKGCSIYVATREAEAVFRELLTLVPTSVPALRAYSEFLLEVTNNPSLAAELMNDADQLEDEASKSQSLLKDVSEFEFGSIASFDMSADGIALMTVSARNEVDAFGGPSTLGAVTFGNPAALRTLGYSLARRELLGKEMSILIPNPIAPIHPSYLSSFVQTGIQRLSGSSRSLFAIHRGGYIIPIYGHVQATGDQWLVAFEEVPAPHIAFLWVMDEESGFRISAACRRALSLLGVSVASLRANSVSLNNYCQNVSSMLSRVQSSPGSVIQLSGLPQRSGSRSRIERKGSMQSVKSTRSYNNNSASAVGNYCAFVQELSVPLVSSSIFVMKLLAASESEIAAAENIGHIPRRIVENDSEDDSFDDGFNAKTRGSSITSSSDFDLLAVNRRKESKSDEEEDDDDDSDRVSINIDSGEDVNVNDKKTETKKLTKKKKASSSKQKADTPTKSLFSSNNRVSISSKRKLSSKADAFGYVSDRPRHAVGFVESKTSAPVVFTETADLNPSSSLYEGINEEPSSSSSSSSFAAARPVFGGGIREETVHNSELLSSLTSLSPSPLQKKNSLLPKKSSTKGFKVPGIAILATVGSPLQSPVHSTTSHPSQVSQVKSIAAPKIFEVNSELERAHQINPSPVNKRTVLRSKRKNGGAAISVSSGGSTGSRLMTTSEQIRSGVAMRSRRIESSLVRLRGAMLMVFFVVCCTNIVSYVVTRVLTEKVLESLVEMREIAKVGTFVRRSVSTLQLGVLANEGKYTYPDDIVWIRERIRTTVNSAEEGHRKLYRLAIMNGPGPQIDSYLLPTLTSTNLVPGTYVDKDVFNTTEEKVSLSNLMIDYAVRMRVIWFYNLSQYNRNDTDIFWILNSAPALVDALNASIFIAASSTSSADSVRLGNAVVLAVALAVFVFVALFVIVPATLEVVREQREVFDVFSAVPVKVIRHIRDRLSERITTLNRAAAGEDDGDFVETFPDDHHGEDKDDKDDAASVDSKNLRARHTGGGSLSLAVAQSVAKDAKNAAAQFDFEDDPKRAALARRRVFYSSFFACCCSNNSSVTAPGGGGGTPFHRSSKRKFSKNASGFSTLLLKMLWPVLCFVAYYTGMYFQRSSVADMATSTRASSQWVCELEVLVPAVGYAFRNALLFHEPLFTDKWMLQLEDHVGFLDYVTEAVAYGKASLNLPSLITSSLGSAELLLIENGCVDSTMSASACAMGGKPPECTYFYPVSACKKPVDSTDIHLKVFASGVVGTGLLPAIQQLSRQVHAVIRSRRASFAQDGFYEEEDILDHGDSYDIINKMCLGYLPAGLESLSDVVLKESTTMINASMSIDILAVICSIIALIGFYVFLYAPLVSFLDNEIKRTRFLLLLFPEEVSKGIPAVVEAGHRLSAGV
jgi:hypothetical protein